MTADGQTKDLDLSTPLQFLKGCGPRRAEQLARLGLVTARDLLFFFPRDYEDLTDLREIEELEEGPPVSVVGVVEDVELRGSSRGRTILGVLVRRNAGFLRALWFNQPYWREKLFIGQTILLSGRAKRRAGRWEMVHPRLRILENDSQPPAGELLPVYPLTEGLFQRHVRSLTRRVLEPGIVAVDEVFPAAYLAEHDLWPIRVALPQIHFPESAESLRRARRRFIYQELFILQLALAVKRRQTRDQAEAAPLRCTAKIDQRIRRLFPFPLTPGQDQVVSEIVADMAQPHPMNRLLQGDVGAGKTAVAAYALLAAIACGAQAALMAPTEVLALQHARTLEKWLAASQVRVGVLTGAIRGRGRDELLAGLRSGEVQLAIGTQALIESQVEFAKLGLVVIDEQHKFGVRQRAELKRAGAQPHYLVMTATPIPRTVAMTLFGDLDVSLLTDRPPGRHAVHTYLPPRDDWGRWWEFFRRKLREGAQGYVITPLVESSDLVELPSVEASFEALANGELEAFRLALVHGRMTSEEKERALEAFRAGKTQVLCATSVVEVGVDVPNATLMTILGADRFGLAQLHQLRGRVSRGQRPGYCCLLCEGETDDSRQRLEALVRCQDGFELAEIDFALRGPGEILGTRQHGLPPLRIADLVRDREVLIEARQDAQRLVADDPGLSRPEHAALRRMMLVRYGKSLELADVG